jgi:hypothetical protein
MYETREEWIARTDRLAEIERLELEGGKRRPSYLMPKIISTPLPSQKVKLRDGIRQNPESPVHDEADQHYLRHKKENL